MLLSCLCVSFFDGNGQFVLAPLKKLPKLTHVSFADNAIETTIPKFRLLIVQELPRIKV